MHAAGQVEAVIVDQSIDDTVSEGQARLPNPNPNPSPNPNPNPTQKLF